MAKKKQKPKSDNLDEAIANIKNKFGNESLIGMNEAPSVPCYSTGSIRLDRALGRGVARGRVVELYGHESSGKTTICLAIAAQVQKEGDRVFMVDAEHAFDPEWAMKLGVNLDDDMFQLSQPGSGEEAWQIVDALANAGAPLVIVDSIAALVPQAELHGEIGDSHVGLQARMNGQAMRKLAGICKKNQCTVLLINQTRDTIGGGGFGPSTTTPGGKAIKFAASQRFQVFREAQLKAGDAVIGQKCGIKVVKNKVAPPFKTASVDIFFHCGTSPEAELVDLAIEGKIFKQAGAWIKYGDENVGQGRENARLALVENTELREEIRAKVTELD